MLLSFDIEERKQSSNSCKTISLGSPSTLVLYILYCVILYIADPSVEYLSYQMLYHNVRVANLPGTKFFVESCNRCQLI